MNYSIEDLPVYEILDADVLIKSFTVLIVDDEYDIQSDCEALTELRYYTII